MLTHMSSNDAGIKIVAAARRVPNNDANGFAVVEFMLWSVCVFSRRVSPINTAIRNLNCVAITLSSVFVRRS